MAEPSEKVNHGQGNHDPMDKVASNKYEKAIKCPTKKHRQKNQSKKHIIESLPCFESVERTTNLDSATTFKDFGLDEQLLKAKVEEENKKGKMAKTFIEVIGELGWERPTLVQSRMIPAVFENKNILARARTGSGKTAAFMLPIVQKILQLKCNSSSNRDAGPYVLFIVPSKELAKQTYLLLCRLTEKFPFLLSLNFAELNVNTDDDWLLKKPDFIVSTPSRLLHALRRYGKPCESVKHVVLDEADLLLSFGYAEEMR
ncbi:DEAD/DEAH box helicase [Dirofilaria immitis]|nr:DEAD/DEAH box helicase [Dirofilaria immitis]